MSASCLIANIVVLHAGDTENGAVAAQQYVQCMFNIWHVMSQSLSFLADFTKLIETCIIPRTGDPVWNEAHTVAVAHDVRDLRFLVKDNDRLSAEHVAEVLCSTHLSDTATG